jgi:hypothetical protein
MQLRRTAALAEVLALPSQDLDINKTPQRKCPTYQQLK